MSAREWLVSYEANVYAESPQEAAEILAELLSEPGIPARGAYTVRDEEEGTVEIIDLGEQKGEW